MDKMKKANALITIKGIVIPNEWTQNGHVVAVSILTLSEEEYLVENDHRGRELLHCLRQQVEATGMVTEEAGCKSIAVRRYGCVASE